MKLHCISFLLAFSLTLSHGYRVLGIFAFNGKSHFVMFEQLMKGLARRGHQVDVVSTFPQKKPYANYTDLIVVPTPRHYVNNLTYTEMKTVLSTVSYAVASLAGNNLCEFLGHPEMQNLIKNPPKNPPYDLVIIEIFGANCFAVLGNVLNVPVVGVSSSVLYPWHNHLIANPENLAFVPNNLLNFRGKMNFWQRLYNTVHTAYNKFYFDYITTKWQDESIRKYVGPNMPSVAELEKNISIILTNSHLTLNGVRPQTPALIEVGGLHVQDSGSKLDPTLEKWMNDSTAGFVYFSFGSMVKIESFPRKSLNVFYKSLGKIAPVRVLMKIADPSELPPGLPKNIHTEQWLNQYKVLSHPNIRVFISHGGLMGTQEAVHFGVPIIGIPLFADQFVNIDTYVEKNVAVKLDTDNLSEAAMDAALNAVLKDPVYRKTAKALSQRFRDRPLSILDTACYWIEYVIKYGNDALRSPAIDLDWWQIALLDVYVFLLIAFGVIAFFTVIIVRALMNVRYGSSAPRVPLSKKVT